MTPTFVPFSSDHIEAAAALLAARHRRDREAHPALPERFEAPAIAATAVAKTWARPHGSGVAAFEGDRLLGYLFADLSLAGNVRSAWVRLSGHALAPGANPGLYRDLYAAAAEAWVQLGCFEHYIFLPGHDAAAREAMFHLSFGYSQAYALLSVKGAEENEPAPEFTIRRAGPEDADLLAGLSPLIVQNAVRSPAFVPIPPDELPELAQGYAELASDPDWTVWLAVENGRVLGFQAYAPAPGAEDNLIIPDDCLELKVAATHPTARGRGVGTALGHHGLQHARRQGYAHCLTDWHIPSLLASRFWPRFGWQIVAYRLVRRLDSRLAWARATPPPA